MELVLATTGFIFSLFALATSGASLYLHWRLWRRKPSKALVPVPKLPPLPEDKFTSPWAAAGDVDPNDLPLAYEDLYPGIGND